MKILFVCSYGGAKSVIAASYFNRLAKEHELDLVGVAASAEEPYDAVPSPVADRLEREGFDVRGFKPHRARAGEMESAVKVITIDCEVSGAEGVERWDGVPQASVDLDASAAAIRRHVEALVERLDGER